MEMVPQQINMLKAPLRFALFFAYRSIHCPSTAVFAAVRPAQSTGKKRFRRPVQQDAHKLVNYVCGSNLLKEGGEDVKLKDDSEYPDWIWELKLDGPKQLSDLDKDSKEYWELLAFQGNVRKMRLMRTKPRIKKTVSRHIIAREEWLERLKHRVVATQEYDAGYNPKDLEDEVDRKFYLKPQPLDEPLYLDEFQIPPKFN